MKNKIELKEYHVLAAMQKRGGSFVRALAAAYSVADPINKEKLKKAFPEYWETYTEYARLELEILAEPDHAPLTREP